MKTQSLELSRLKHKTHMQALRIKQLEKMLRDAAIYSIGDQVRCISTTGAEKTLTLNKLYRVQEVFGLKAISVYDDTERFHPFNKERFEYYGA